MKHLRLPLLAASAVVAQGSAEPERIPRDPKKTSRIQISQRIKKTGIFDENEIMGSSKRSGTGQPGDKKPQTPQYINEARRNRPPVPAQKNVPKNVPSPTESETLEAVTEQTETVTTITPPFLSNKIDPLDVQLKEWIQHNGGLVHPDLNVFTSDDPLHHHHFHQRQKRLKKEREKKLRDDSWPLEREGDQGDTVKETAFLASSPTDESESENSELSEQDSISLYAHDGYVHSVAERVANSLSASGGGFVGPGSNLANLRNAVQKWIGEGSDGVGGKAKGGSIFAGKGRAAYRGVDMRCTHDHDDEDNHAHHNHEHEELLLRVPRKIAFSHKVCEDQNAGDDENDFQGDDFSSDFSDNPSDSFTQKNTKQRPFPLYAEFFSNYRGRSRTTNVEKTVICFSEYLGKMIESGWELSKEEKNEWIKNSQKSMKIIKDTQGIGGIHGVGGMQSAGKGGMPVGVGSSSGMNKQFGDDMNSARERVVAGSLGIDSDGMDASGIAGVGSKSLATAEKLKANLKQTGDHDGATATSDGNVLQLDDIISDMGAVDNLDNLLFDLPAIEKSALSTENNQDHLNNFLPLFRSISTLGSTVDELPLLKLYDELCAKKSCDRVCKGSNVVVEKNNPDHHLHLLRSEREGDNHNNLNQGGAGGVSSSSDSTTDTEPVQFNMAGGVVELAGASDPAKEGKSSNIQMNMSIIGGSNASNDADNNDENMDGNSVNDYANTNSDPVPSKPVINFHSCPVGSAQKPTAYSSVDVQAFALAENLNRISQNGNINMSSMSNAPPAPTVNTNIHSMNTPRSPNTVPRKPLSVTTIMGPGSPLLRRLKTRLRGLRELFDELEYFRMSKYEEYLEQNERDNHSVPEIGQYEDDLEMYKLLEKQNRDREKEGKTPMPNPKPTPPKGKSNGKGINDKLKNAKPFVQPFSFRDFVRLYSFVFSHSHSVKEEEGMKDARYGYNGKTGIKSGSAKTVTARRSKSEAKEISGIVDSSSGGSTHSSSGPLESPAIAMIVPYANLINHSVECGDACEKARSEKGAGKGRNAQASNDSNDADASGKGLGTVSSGSNTETVPAELASLLTSTNNQAESQGFDENFRPTLHAVLRGDEDYFEVWMKQDEKNNLANQEKAHTHYDQKSKKTYSHSHKVTEGEIFLKYARKTWLNRSSYGVSHFFEQFGIIDPSLSTTFELQPALTPEFPLFALKSQRFWSTSVIESKMRTLRDVDFLEENGEGDAYGEEYADSIFAPELHRAAKRAGDALETATSMMGWAVGTVMRGGWIGKQQLVEGGKTAGGTSGQASGRGSDNNNDKKADSEDDDIAGDLANLASFNVNAANSLEALGPLCISDRMWFESAPVSSHNVLDIDDTSSPTVDTSLPKTLTDWTTTDWKSSKWRSSKYKSTLEFKSFLLIDCHDENLEKDRDEARERVYGMKEAHKKKSKSAYYKELLPLARFLVSGDEGEECLAGGESESGVGNNMGNSNGKVGNDKVGAHNKVGGHKVGAHKPKGFKLIKTRGSPFCEEALANKVHELSAYRFVERELARLLRDYPLETSWIEKRELPYVWLREREVQCLSTLRSENRHAFENFVWGNGGTLKETLSAKDSNSNTAEKSKSTDNNNSDKANTVASTLASASTMGIASAVTGVANVISSMGPPTVTPPSVIADPKPGEFSHGLASDIRPVRRQEISVSAPGLSDPLNQLWVVMWIIGAGFWAVVQKVVGEYREALRRRKMV